METKVYNSVKVITLILFIIFITMFFASFTGYYDYENKKQAIMTEEKIKQFEQDVKNGVNLDLTNYIDKPKNNYNSFLAKVGSKTSKFISNTVSSSVSNFFGFLIKFVDQK